jgi:hypothetical protein
MRNPLINGSIASWVRAACLAFTLLGLSSAAQAQITGLGARPMGPGVPPTPTPTQTPVPAVVVPTLSLPMLALFGLTLVSAAAFLLKRR